MFKRMVLCDACDKEVEMSRGDFNDDFKPLRNWIQLVISRGDDPDSNTTRHLCEFCARRLERVLYRQMPYRLSNWNGRHIKYTRTRRPQPIFSRHSISG